MPPATLENCRNGRHAQQRMRAVTVIMLSVEEKTAAAAKWASALNSWAMSAVLTAVGKEALRIMMFAVSPVKPKTPTSAQASSGRREAAVRAPSRGGRGSCALVLRDLRAERDEGDGDEACEKYSSGTQSQRTCAPACEERA